MQKVEKYFKDYPASDKCFVTSDEMIFHKKGDANMHADSLEDKEVTEFTRGKVKTIAAQADAKAKAEADEKKKAEADAKAKEKAEADAKKKAEAGKK